MKKNFVIVVVCLSIYGCKKNSDTVQPTSTGTTTPMGHFIAQINGNNFSADTYSSAASASNSGTYSLQGNESMAINNPTISISGKIQKGTFTLGPSPSVNTAYYIYSNIKFNAISGSITVTDIDTLNKALIKYKATFNFNTDTLKGMSFQVKNGDVSIGE